MLLLFGRQLPENYSELCEPVCIGVRKSRERVFLEVEEFVHLDLLEGVAPRLEAPVQRRELWRLWRFRYQGDKRLPVG